MKPQVKYSPSQLYSKTCNLLSPCRQENLISRHQTCSSQGSTYELKGLLKCDESYFSRNIIFFRNLLSQSPDLNSRMLPCNTDTHAPHYTVPYHKRLHSQSHPYKNLVTAHFITHNPQLWVTPHCHLKLQYSY